MTPCLEPLWPLARVRVATFATRLAYGGCHTFLSYWPCRRSPLVRPHLVLGSAVVGRSCLLRRLLSMQPCSELLDAASCARAGAKVRGSCVLVVFLKKSERNG